MRNLLEYPVTLDEIVGCLERLRDREAAKKRIGDITPMLLEMAIMAVRYRALKLWERGDLGGMATALDPLAEGSPEPAVLTAEAARLLLSYDPETGEFRWRHRRGQKSAGAVAGKTMPTGYRSIKIAQREYRAHRLAWLMQTGSWPVAEIDHINGVRDDNRFCNLREATREQNLANRPRYPSNTSGFKGVTWSKSAGKWVAKMRHKKRCLHIGHFDSPEAASAAYQAKATEIYGEFARSSFGRPSSGWGRHGRTV